MNKTKIRIFDKDYWLVEVNGNLSLAKTVEEAIEQEINKTGELVEVTKSVLDLFYSDNV